MKNRHLLLLLPFLLLTACGNKEDGTNQNTDQNNTQSGDNNETGGNTETGGGGGTETGGGNTETGGGGGTETGGGGTQEMKPHDYEVPTNTPYSLEGGQTFNFCENNEPVIPDNWNYYIKTTLNPYSSNHYENPVKPNLSGMEFTTNSYIVSPVYKCWPKLELRFEFWFSSHTSSNYKASANKPQFYLECYDQYENKLETRDINIARSDIPTNSTTKTIKQYVYQPTCNHFILRFNNYIPNGNSGYSAVIVSSTLIGWPYSK